jgi:ubiquinone/menaquinone biosynthesis C-methylase UbiE
MNASNQKSGLRVRDVRRGFDRAAQSFDKADFVHGVTRDGLLTRIRPMTVEATTVLDLGAGTGNAIRLLQKRFRGARVIAVDSSRSMLQAARSKRGLLSKQREVQADATALPFADGSVDVVFCNLLLPWFDRPDGVFTEIARVLRIDGLFAFSTLCWTSTGCPRATAAAKPCFATLPPLVRATVFVSASRASRAAASCSASSMCCLRQVQVARSHSNSSTATAGVARCAGRASTLPWMPAKFPCGGNDLRHCSRQLTRRPALRNKPLLSNRFRISRAQGQDCLCLHVSVNFRGS